MCNLEEWFWSHQSGLGYLIRVSSSTMRSQSASGTAELRNLFKMAKVFPQCPGSNRKEERCEAQCAKVMTSVRVCVCVCACVCESN